MPRVSVFLDSPTPFDIRFRFLNFPCNIGGLFWVGTVMMSGLSLDNQQNLKLLLVWVLAVLISIFVHELGHAIAARKFGCKVILVKLTMMGGYCSYDREPRSLVQRIIISLAGPGAGFLLAGVLKLLDHQFQLFDKLGQVSPLFSAFYAFMMWINLFWGLINLLPILPLDGGRVCETVCEMKQVREPTTRTRWIGIVIAVALALFAFAYSTGNLPKAWYASLPWWCHPSIGMGIFFAVLALINYQSLAAERYGTGFDSRFHSPEEDEGEEWKRR